MEGGLLASAGFVLCGWLAAAPQLGPQLGDSEPLTLHLRRQVPEEGAPERRWRTRDEVMRWDPGKSALLVCDLWDRHWCAGATARVAEMAPAVARTVAAARARGLLVIHCPSDTMAAYEGTAARERARAAPFAPFPSGADTWHPLDPTKEEALPIDDADDGCDCTPRCQGFTAWKSQIASVPIADADAVTDSGQEVWNLLEQRGIEQVLVCGVHLNMCVLGRPFGIRRLTELGKQVALLRDLTDTMYCSKSFPRVDHFRGTDLMVGHVERYWCPTLLSSDLTGAAPFRFAADHRPRIALLVAEDEYHAWETLPAFAEQELAQTFGFQCDVISAPPRPALDRVPGQLDPIPGIERILDADLLLLFARRRTLPEDELAVVKKYVESKTPIVAVRTASHAFQNWLEFDPLVLGGSYHGHHGNGGDGAVTLVEAAPAARAAPSDGSGFLLRGVPTSGLVSKGSLYQPQPLAPTAKPVLFGSIDGLPQTREPVAWTNVQAGRRVFYTSLGHPADFAQAWFRRLLVNAIFWGLGQEPPFASRAEAAAQVQEEQAAASRSFHDGWHFLEVPGPWETQGIPELEQADGFAWYRCFFEVPLCWRGQALALELGVIDNADETWFNGVPIGATGRMPPDYENGVATERRYAIPPELVHPGDWNAISVRVFDEGGKGGFKSSAPDAPLLFGTSQALDLGGKWQFRLGDDLAWGELSDERDVDAWIAAVTAFRDGNDRPPGRSGTLPREPLDWSRQVEHGRALTPQQALEAFEVNPDFEVSLACAEPQIRQPVEVQFDARGRMWVVQYLQYMYPAGLVPVSKDQYDRTKYDRVPEPPPRGPAGADRITICEDLDGDGYYETTHDFVSGLNLATSVALAPDGVYVAQTPYLLFYRDANHDDRPDGDPEVCLEGFGMEDAHAVVNSLTWGPDGWLYGAQGSTCTASVRGQGFQQAAWRYHPKTKEFEVFDEGGGNTFGLEFDPTGELLTGTNWADFVMVHYVQGGFHFKGFDKHGPLHDPYTYGWFPHCPHEGEAAGHVAQVGLIYQGGTWGDAYAWSTTRPDGRLGTWVMPHLLGNRVSLHDVFRNGSTYRTKFSADLLTTKDSWFRPVDLALGPDGAVYIADWYDQRATHLIPKDNWDKTNGRVWRVQMKGGATVRSTAGEMFGRTSFNLQEPSGPALKLYQFTYPFLQDVASLSDDARIAARRRVSWVNLLNHPNGWIARAAQGLLRVNEDDPVTEFLRDRCRTSSDPAQRLSGLFALAQSGGFTEELGAGLLFDRAPEVRKWAIRLLCDAKWVLPETATRLADLAWQEPDVTVLSQLAASAGRLPAVEALPVIDALLARDEHADDPLLPLRIWWALEPFALPHREEVLALFLHEAVGEAQPRWRDRGTLAENEIVPRLMRRYADDGSPESIETCARLLERAVALEELAELTAPKLVDAFAQSLEGRQLAQVPERVAAALDALVNQLDGESRAQVAVIAMRLGSPQARARLLSEIENSFLLIERRCLFISALAEKGGPDVVDPLLRVARSASEPPVRKAALAALARFDDARIAPALLALWKELPAGSDLRAQALDTLSKRKASAQALAAAITAKAIDFRELPYELVERLAFFDDPELDRFVRKTWGDLRASDAAKQETIARLKQVLAAGNEPAAMGDPVRGRELFMKSCAICHTLFGEGKQVGPKLDDYERTNTDFLLLSIVDPSAAIREGFISHVLWTKDGLLLTGLLAGQTASAVTIDDGERGRVTVPRDQIDRLGPASKSRMPEGLLEALNDMEVRDLFAYLRRSLPLAR